MSQIPLPVGWFVTGTDTDVGKTLVASALLHALGQRGVCAAGMKPVSAGAVWREGAWHYDDAERLAAASPLTLLPTLAAPYKLRTAASPHIAAPLDNVQIDPAHLLRCYQQIAAKAQTVVVEGAGGFCVPLSADFDSAMLAQQFGLPVLLVVGLRLGCINHALLTAEAIRARGLVLAGWVANQIDVSMPHLEDNIATLRTRLAAPLLGMVPRLAQPTASAAASCLDFSGLPGWPATSAASR